MQEYIDMLEYKYIAISVNAGVEKFSILGPEWTLRIVNHFTLSEKMTIADTTYLQISKYK